MSQGPVGPAGEDLLGLGVAAVVFFGLQHHDRGIGEQGVVAPGGEKLALARGRFLVQVLDAADDQQGSGVFRECQFLS
jgi:hypothetical protein